MTSSKLVLFLCGLLISTNVHARGAGNTGGGCYNLNVIALKSKSADMTGTNGHSLFVLQNGNTKILLQEGPYNVIDRNGTDGSAAFSLPNPDPTNSGTTLYSVFARLVGKPGSALNMATCGVDSVGDTYCSQDTLSLKRIAGTMYKAKPEELRGDRHTLAVGP